MHHHTGFLVNHHEVGILVNHIYGQVFCHNACVVARTVEHERYHVARTNLVIALHWAFVHMHEARVGSRLYTVARGVWQLLRHELVYAQWLHAWVCHKTEVLVELSCLVVGLIGVDTVDVEIFNILYFFCHSLHLMFLTRLRELSPRETRPHRPSPPQIRPRCVLAQERRYSQCPQWSRVVHCPLVW